MFTAFSFCAFLGMILLICVLLQPRLVAGWNGLGPVARLDGLIKPILSREKLLAIALLAFGVALRVWELLRSPTALLPEEAWTALEAQSLLENGVALSGKPWPAMLPGWGTEGEGPLLAWLSMPAVALFGPSALAVRLPSFLLSCLAMTALYDTVRRIASPRAALWVLLLCVVSPWHLLQSRWSLSWALLPHLLVLALWAWMRGHHTFPWSLAASLILGLAMYTGDTAWHVVPMLALCAALIQWRCKALRWWQALAGLLVFLALAFPAFSAWQGQMAEASMQSGSEEAAYPHVQDSVWRVTRSVREGRPVAQDVDAEMEAGLQFLPFLRGHVPFEMLYENLFDSGYRMLSHAMFQSFSDTVYTKAYLLPAYGSLYLFTVPLTLLGFLLFLLRPLWQRGAWRSLGVLRKRGELLSAALVVSALPFLLLHIDLAAPHYLVLFYPMLLLSAYGIVFLTRRLRLTGILLVVLYTFALGGFLAAPEDLSHTFPGFDEAVQEAVALDSEKLAVTTRLYPHDDPVRVAEAKTVLGFGLSPAYMRGEITVEDELPYQERFSFVHIPSFDWSAAKGIPLIVHESEAYTLPAEGYDFRYFEEYVLLVPQIEEELAPSEEV